MNSDTDMFTVLGERVTCCNYFLIHPSEQQLFCAASPLFARQLDVMRTRLPEVMAVLKKWHSTLFTIQTFLYEFRLNKRDTTS